MATRAERRQARLPPPLIPAFLWRWIPALLLVLAAIAGVLAVYVNGKVGALSSERGITDWLRGLDVPDHTWGVGLAPGSAVFFVVVVVALAGWTIWQRNWPALVACATVPGAVVLVEEVLKPIADRRYAWYLPLCYPSGTAAGVAAWTTLAWLLAVPFLRRPLWRGLLALGFALLTLGTAVAVVASEKHLPLDAVGGVAVGMGVVLACAAVIDIVTRAHREPRRAPVVPRPARVPASD